MDHEHTYCTLFYYSKLNRLTTFLDTYYVFNSVCFSIGARLNRLARKGAQFFINSPGQRTFQVDPILVWRFFFQTVCKIEIKIVDRLAPSAIWTRFRFEKARYRYRVIANLRFCAREWNSKLYLWMYIIDKIRLIVCQETLRKQSSGCTFYLRYVGIFRFHFTSLYVCP